MSVMLETTLGELVVDLYCDKCPLAAKNFLKLCKTKYYNGVLVYNVQQNFMIQTGDPSGTGRGGTSIYGMLYGEQAKYFEDEIRLPQLKHSRPGLVCMASSGENQNTSQFYITMRGEDMEFLDGKHTIFGEVAEGLDTVLKEINELYCDTDGRPYRDVRILHTYVLDDPFDDPKGIEDLIPDASPARGRPEAESVNPRLIDLEDEEDGLTAEALEERIREVEAKKRAVVLEMIGDLPDAEIKPPENVLFVCKLNPITTDEDLEIIFSRFGTGVKAEICRDPVTGDSLNYAFVEFDDVESCEEAYKKMNNALVDDRRIKVDFSQSVAKQWNRYTMRPRGSTKIKSRGAGFQERSPDASTLLSASSAARAGNGGGRNGKGSGLESGPRTSVPAPKSRWEESAAGKASHGAVEVSNRKRPASPTGYQEGRGRDSGGEAGGREGRKGRREAQGERSQRSRSRSLERIRKQIRRSGSPSRERRERRDGLRERDWRDRRERSRDRSQSRELRRRR